MIKLSSVIDGYYLSFKDTGAEGSSDLLLWLKRCLASVLRPSICPDFFFRFKLYSRTAR